MNTYKYDTWTKLTKPLKKLDLFWLSIYLYHAVYNSNVLWIVRKPWIHIFTEELHHVKRWNMIVIKRKPLHATIKMRWIIIFFDTKVIDLRKHPTHTERSTFNKKNSQLYTGTKTTETNLEGIYCIKNAVPCNDLRVSYRAQTWPAREDYDTLPAFVLQGMTLPICDPWCRSCQDHNQQQAFAAVASTPSYGCKSFYSGNWSVCVVWSGFPSSQALALKTSTPFLLVSTMLPDQRITIYQQPPKELPILLKHTHTQNKYLQSWTWSLRWIGLKGLQVLKQILGQKMKNPPKWKIGGRNPRMSFWERKKKMWGSRWPGGDDDLHFSLVEKEKEREIGAERSWLGLESWAKFGVEMGAGFLSPKCRTKLLC